ncbi:protein S40-4-like [Phragmites australis]|uniref:protein S40-4-like n=1 Tax=Phragmites australis TaxID=29695 RepID=UPI002D794C61|nr:protein S40-4-like [Phragmites australis]
MARSTLSAEKERAYLQFAPSPLGVVPSPAEEFDESDIWGALYPAASDPKPPGGSPRARHPVPAIRPNGRKTKPAMAVGRAAHGSLPVNIPDWSKILGDEYRGHHAGGDWELDDADADDVDAVVPPHELAWRRRAASLSVHEGAGVVGRTLKVRDAVWKRTTGFQD